MSAPASLIDAKPLRERHEQDPNELPTPPQRDVLRALAGGEAPIYPMNGKVVRGALRRRGWATGPDTSLAITDAGRAALARDDDRAERVKEGGQIKIDTVANRMRIAAMRAEAGWDRQLDDRGEPMADADGVPLYVRPAKPQRVRVRDLRTEPRKTTVAIRRISQEELRAGELMYPPVEGRDEMRPKTRAECESGGHNEARPCPWVACKYHLALDVNPESGSITLNRPHLESWEIPETCTLDVADRGGIPLEEVGAVMNVTRERIRQLEAKGIAHLAIAAK
jgi:hypothetical protein